MQTKEFGALASTPPHKAKRESYKAALWDRGFIGTGQHFQMSDGAQYVLAPSGAFVRLNKDRRSVKARKAERQKRRAEMVSAGAQTTK